MFIRAAEEQLKKSEAIMSDPSCLGGFLSCMSHPVLFLFSLNATAAEQNGP